MCIGNALAVNVYEDGNSGSIFITEIPCSQYDSNSYSEYLSVYRDDGTDGTLAGDWAYFKQTYCGTLTSIQADRCFIIDRDDEPLSKVVVADCAVGMPNKIYFIADGGAMQNGTVSTEPTMVEAYISFTAACDQCTGSTTGSWTTTGAPTGYQVMSTTKKSPIMCNHCKTTTSSVFR